MTALWIYVGPVGSVLVRGGHPLLEEVNFLPQHQLNVTAYIGEKDGIAVEPVPLCIHEDANNGPGKNEGQVSLPVFLLVVAVDRRMLEFLHD
jgi:hypothetical protein